MKKTSKSKEIQKILNSLKYEDSVKFKLKPITDKIWQKENEIVDASGEAIPQKILYFIVTNQELTLFVEDDVDNEGLVYFKHNESDQELIINSSYIDYIESVISKTPLVFKNWRGSDIIITPEKGMEIDDFEMDNDDCLILFKALAQHLGYEITDEETENENLESEK